MGPFPSRGGPSPPLCPLLFFLLLLGGLWPVFGNEGGTAGSCDCKRRVTIQPDRLIQWVKSWEKCQQSGQEYVRFIFQNFSLCVLPDNPEANTLKEKISQKENARADASKGSQGPPAGTPKAQPDPHFRTDAPPTSRRPPTAQSDPRFPTDAPQTTGPQQEETPATPMPSEPPFTPGAAVGRPGRPPTPQQGSAPSQPPPRGSSSSHTTIAIISLLGIVLILVVIVVSLVCRTRRRRRRRCPDGPLHPAAMGEETHRLNLPEET